MAFTICQNNRSAGIHVPDDCIIEPEAAALLRDLGIDTDRSTAQDYTPEDRRNWFYVPPEFSSRFEYRSGRKYSWLSVRHAND